MSAKLAAGYDRFRQQTMGGPPPAVPPMPAAKPQFTLEALQALKAQQGVGGPYQTPPALQARLQAIRGQGAQAAASQFGVVPQTKVAFLPALGGALATGARMALPFLGRMMGSRVAQGAAMNAGMSMAGHAIGTGSTQGMGRAGLAGAAQGAMFGALPGPKMPGSTMPPAIGQV